MMKKKRNSSGILILAIVSLTGTMGQRFYNAPKLDIGTKSPQTILAPFDATVEDVKQTEEQRKAARKGATPVLRINQEVNQQINQDLERSLLIAREMRTQAGAFPFISPNYLSISAQISLRNASKQELENLLANLGFTKPEFANAKKEENQKSSNLKNLKKQPLPPKLNTAFKELKIYHQISSRKQFASLIKTIFQYQQSYQQALGKSVNFLSATDTHVEIVSSVLDLSDLGWQKTEDGIREAASRILTQGIPQGLPANILERAAVKQVDALVPQGSETLATEILLAVLRPNLIEDQAQTKLNGEQAAQAIKPIKFTIRKGEVIVVAGQIIDQKAFVLLDKFDLSRRGISWQGFIWFGGLVSFSILIFWEVEKRFHPYRRKRDYLLVLLLTLSTPVLQNLGLPYLNLPLIGLLVSNFYGGAVGVTVVGLMGAILPISMEISWDYLLATTTASLVGAILAEKMRSREELALLGGVVGLTQAGIYLLINLIFSSTATSVWYMVLQESALYGFSSLVWSIVALGLSPYLEHLFDLITPIRLAELSNPNRPLLKRFAALAPGTFQHTLFVATLAEAAAHKLGCNVELVRAGTLYHDIGKMHDPLGFIENQMGGINKHEEINDPWKSAEIIKKHVSEGLVMARKYRLPKAIQAFIPEHQGTILIAYFYHQAQQLVIKEKPHKLLNDSDFRYDGPIPQSKETGIVMLADASEAALRSLKEATYEEAFSMINKILRARWQDNQLIDSGLTREELSIIAEVFVQVWQQYNHQRIAYPKLAVK